MSDTEHPARLASQRSMKAVMSHDRDTWLSLFHPDACIEDPIGKSPIDPTGEGIRGTAAIEKFYDDNVAPNRHEFEVHRSFAAGNEVANVLTLTTTLANGMTGSFDGVFTYRVDADGKILNLRGFWELDQLFESFNSRG